MRQHFGFFFAYTIKPPLQFSLAVCFYARTNLNWAVGSRGFTCLPYQSSALESPPYTCTPLHIWLHTYFCGFLFPIKQKPCTSSSGQPVSEVLWNVTQTPWEHSEGRLPASVCSTLFAGSGSLFLKLSICYSQSGLTFLPGRGCLLGTFCLQAIQSQDCGKQRQTL